jgi:hypothetical protein
LAWGQAEFQEGRDVRTLFLRYLYWYLERPKAGTWACPDSESQEQVTYTREEATERSSRRITNGTAAELPLPPWLWFLTPLHACSCNQLANSKYPVSVSCVVIEWI